MHQTTKTYLERKHSILLSVTRMLYVYQVCHGVGRCVKHGSCSSSRLEWKLMDSINGISYYLNKRQTLSNTSQMTFFLSGRQHIGAHALCMQHSSTPAALSTSFLLNHSPPTAPNWTHWLHDLGSHTAAYYLWVKKTEETKERLVQFWQCTDTASEWKKCDFCVSPFCQVVLKHKLFEVAQ